MRIFRVLFKHVLSFWRVSLDDCVLLFLSFGIDSCTAMFALVLYYFALVLLFLLSCSVIFALVFYYFWVRVLLFLRSCSVIFAPMFYYSCPRVLLFLGSCAVIFGFVFCNFCAEQTRIFYGPHVNFLENKCDFFAEFFFQNKWDFFTEQT